MSWFKKAKAIKELLPKKKSKKKIDPREEALKGRVSEPVIMTWPRWILPTSVGFALGILVYSKVHCTH